MIRLALAGPGNISRRFLKGMKGVKNAELVAFVSRDPSRVKDYAENEGIPNVLTYEEFYSSKDIDAVYICVPDVAHYDIAKKSLLSGKHVLLEKPMCRSSKEILELFSLAEEKGLFLMEAQKSFYTPAYAKIKELLDEKAIGEVKYARASWAKNAGNDPSFVDAKSVIFGIGCYPVAMLKKLFPGKITELSIQETPGSASFAMKTEDGILLDAYASFVFGGENELILYGTEGTISCRDFWRGHDVIVKKEEEKVYHFDYDSEFTYETQYFIDRILDGKKNDVISKEETAEIYDIMNGTVK